MLLWTTHGVGPGSQERNIVGVALPAGSDERLGAPVIALVTPPGAWGAELARSWSRAGIPLLRDGAPLVADDHFVSCADDCLAAARATGLVPPEYRPLWESDPLVIAAAERQRQQLLAATAAGAPFARSGAIWFDRHHPWLLDLWVSGPHPIAAAILVWDQPETSVVELQSEGVRQHHAVALWEYSLVHALKTLTGRPVFVCARSRLKDQVQALTEFIQSAGIDLVGTFAFGSSPVVDTERSSERGRLIQVLQDLQGGHAALPEVRLRVSDGSDELLAAHRAALRSALEAREAWLLVNEEQQANLVVKAELDRILAGVHELTSHLLNAVGAP